MTVAGTAAAIEMIDVTIGTTSVVENVAVGGIDWSIAAGDYWVVGGPPGSGKSDLLATMAGLFRPLRGTLRLFGNPVAELGEDDFFWRLSASRRLRMPFPDNSTTPGVKGSAWPAPWRPAPKFCCSTTRWPDLARRNRDGGENSWRSFPAATR
ncbi:MAG: hypothetical protein DME24_19970 [Verrucomicrobia bacterium]|nr:MAG: hypothetical protein DME24_19970 [Verrucomicrobiota bacterium]